MGKEIWKWVATILVAAVVLLAATFAVMKVMGGGVYTVLSGSMEPRYHVGSLLLVKPVDPSGLKAGDVITFVIADDMTATHRIVDIQKDRDDPSVLWFTTKGDANDTEDASPVHENNVIGSPVLAIPYLGYAIAFFRKPPGLYAAIGIIILLLAGSFAGRKAGA